MELVIALVLFVALIGCWLMLPASATSSAVLGASEVAAENTVTARVNA